ncbi:MAG TPA: Flp pilus assembly protein CpaB [Rhizomicrobium sp.]|jgi:pilus assembly protein CpaB|nr:Flp pilus assembly protein CpaB [Rhizomicrobium sp.]
MNTQRLIILGVAAIAAAGAAFLARGLLGGGTQKVNAEPAPIVTTEQVLVASNDIQSGTKLTPDMVKWRDWPKSAVDASFVTHDVNPDVNKLVADAVARTPLVAGEPLTANNVVHSDSAGFMAATLTPGMRAVSIPVTTETGAGGFILPNDRVDVMSTTQISESPRRFGTRILLANVRVLAVDQTYKEDNTQKTVLAKTATLELSPTQTKVIEKAQASGIMSLALRPLASQNPTTVVAALKKEKAESKELDTGTDDDQGVSIIRYGIARAEAPQQKE